MFDKQNIMVCLGQWVRVCQGVLRGQWRLQGPTSWEIRMWRQNGIIMQSYDSRKTESGPTSSCNAKESVQALASFLYCAYIQIFNFWVIHINWKETNTHFSNIEQRRQVSKIYTYDNEYINTYLYIYRLYGVQITQRHHEKYKSYTGKNIVIKKLTRHKTPAQMQTQKPTHIQTLAQTQKKSQQRRRHRYTQRSTKTQTLIHKCIHRPCGSGPGRPLTCLRTPTAWDLSDKGKWGIH